MNNATPCANGRNDADATITTMQCLGCGQTRTTRLAIRRPDRRLSCSVCEHVTLHRSMADPIQGDWREDLNLDPERAREAPSAGPERAAAPMVPPHVQAAFDKAGVVAVFIVGLNREAWLEASATSCGRPLVLLDADLSPDRLAAVAARLLARKDADHEETR